MENLLGDKYPDEITYDQAVSFLQRRGNQFLAGGENPECTAHGVRHPIGFFNMIVGVYNGFDTEQEVIDWVKRLIPLSI